MIWTKGAHESAKFQTFDCSSTTTPNLYFDRLLLLKVYKISVKKGGVMYHDHEDSDAKFKEKLICCLKNDKNLVNCDRSTRNVHKFTL